MSTEIEATILVCDAAQVSNGKLYVLGAGWSRLKPNTPANVALAIVAHIPYDRTNQKITFTATLQDEDGEPVQRNDTQVSGSGEFEVGRAVGLKPGERINVPLVLNFNGLALEEGGYVWACEIDGATAGRWPFRVVG